MLYSNIKLENKIAFSNGITLECTKNVKVHNGMNNLAVMGNMPELKVVDQVDINLHLLLSTDEGGWWIGWGVKNTSSFKLLAKGFGANKERIVLLQLEGAMIDDWVVIVSKGGLQYLHISRKGVDFLESYKDAKDYADANNLQFPCGDLDVHFLDVVWPNAEQTSMLNAEMRMKELEKSLTGAQV